MNEFYFRWDDNTVYSDDRGKTWKKRPQGWSHGNPGEDIECRCHAEPVIDPKKIIEFATARKL